MTNRDQENLPEPTPEMVNFYQRRTEEHIARVAANLMLLAQLSDHADELIERARVHDASKFGPEERVAYIWLTEFHRCRQSDEAFEYPPGVKELVKQATQHHLTTNRHHYQAHVDPNDMTEVDLIEMVCDWTAMAQELGDNGGSARGWADRTVGHRVRFHDANTHFIYSTIEQLDKLNGVNA